MGRLHIHGWQQSLQYCSPPRKSTRRVLLETDTRDIPFQGFPLRVTVSSAKQLVRENTVAKWTEHQLSQNLKSKPCYPFSNSQRPISILSVAKIRHHEFNQRDRLSCLARPISHPSTAREADSWIVDIVCR